MKLAIVRRLIPDWGTTYGPAGDGPFPAVMLLHGSEGGYSGWSHRNAVMLAAHGFLAFPFPYSNGGNAWNAGSIINVPLERTMEAFRALREFAFSGAKAGLFGVSRGAEHALLVTSLMVRDVFAIQAIRGFRNGTRRSGPGRGRGRRTVCCRPHRLR